MKGINIVWISVVVGIVGALLAMVLPLGDFADQSQTVAEGIEASPDDWDGDGISNDDEINGFTLGDVTYFTNPLQSSTDQDPYGDYMEIMKTMPPMVQEPARHPCVPAWPDLSVEVSEIEVETLCTITSTERMTKGWNWSIETESYERAKTDWGVDVELTPFPPFIKVQPYYHNEHETITITESSESGWSLEEWSRAVAFEPARAARLDFHLKIQNRGTDAARDIKLTFNVTIGDNTVATLWTDELWYYARPGETSPEYLIQADRDGNYIEISMEELKSIECGAPITIELIQTDAIVPGTGDISWNEYIANIDVVSSTIMADFGDGDVREYKLWSGINSYPPPDYWRDITLRDAIDRTFGIREEAEDVYFGWKLGEEVELDDWTFGFYEETFRQIVDELPEEWTLDDLLGISIRQGWEVVMKALDIKPPEIHWVIYSTDLKTIMASITDNEKIESVFAHVLIGDEYRDVELTDEEGDTIFEVTLEERITDTEDDYLVASDGINEITRKENIAKKTPLTIEVDDDFADDPANHRWDTIQEGIYDAEDGDVVIVYDGIYTENVKVNKSVAIQSQNGADHTIVRAENSNDDVFRITADYVNINGFTARGASGIGKAGIYLEGVAYCNLLNNIVSNGWGGIDLVGSSDNNISNNTADSNNTYGIHLHSSSNDNSITNNTATLHNNYGIGVNDSNSNDITNNNVINNHHGIFVWGSINNDITNNNINSNDRYGIILHDSSNNFIYFNNFIDNTDGNVNPDDSTNTWNSTEIITYNYKGNIYTNYLGNYWSDYSGVDVDGDGIGDSAYPIDGDSDNYPLAASFENYCPPIFSFIDDFSVDMGMWRYVGSADRDSVDEYVVLTENRDHKVGAIWFDRIIDLPFMIDFKYRAGGGTGADGLVFMFYKQADYTPKDGGKLGFVDASGYVPGYGIEFDSFYSSSYSDPSSRHVALIKDRVSNHLAYADDERVEDNEWHNVKVTVGKSSVAVAIDGDTILEWGEEIDRTFGGIGFSGATGGDNNWHIIDDIRIITTCEACNGTIQVTSDPSGASFTLTGASSYGGTTPRSVANAPMGDYTIAWDLMPGYEIPSSGTMILACVGTISFHGVYVPTPPTWTFHAAGFFPKHLPDDNTGEVVLAGLNVANIPPEVQGVWWYDGPAQVYRFWVPGVGGDLTVLTGQFYNYMVLVTGACEWEFLLP